MLVHIAKPGMEEKIIYTCLGVQRHVIYLPGCLKYISPRKSSIRG